MNRKRIMVRQEAANMKKILIVLLILAALLAGCMAKADEHAPDVVPTNKDDIGELSPRDDDRKFSDTTIIVSFKEAPTEAQLEEVKKICGGEVRNMMMDTIAVIKFEPKTSKAIKVLADKLSQLDYVKSAEPDYIVELPDCSKGPC